MVWTTIRNIFLDNLAPALRASTSLLWEFPSAYALGYAMPPLTGLVFLGRGRNSCCSRLEQSTRKFNPVQRRGHPPVSLSPLVSSNPPCREILYLLVRKTTVLPFGPNTLLAATQ
jgi:hypothetical protein